ncbi:MAG: hypothetical protein KA500_04760 [Rhodoluna sp.]|nr:hypothetical protein [Rhodoluna sp.]
MHRKHIRRWHKFLSASASLVAILATIFVAPANANAAPSVDMFWADVSRTNSPVAYFYLMTNVTVSNVDAGDFLILGTATGCTIDPNFSPSSFHVVAVSNCSDGTLALQLGANSISDSSGNWGPSEGFASDTMTIDRTGPSFVFENQPTSVPDPSFNLVATGFETVALASSLLAPTISGDGCFIAGTSMNAGSLNFVIAGCKPGAQVQVTILQNSYVDQTGNLGPSADVLSQVVSVAGLQTQQLPAAPLPTATPGPILTPEPTPTVSPTASPTPTPTPTQTAAAVAPVSPPPAPPAEPVVAPVVPVAEVEPIAEPVAEQVAEPIVEGLDQTPAAARTVGPRVLAPVVPPLPEMTDQVEPIAKPEPEIVSAVMPNRPAANMSWVAPAASVIATALAAIGAAIFMRKRMPRMARLRVA